MRSQAEDHGHTDKVVLCNRTSPKLFLSFGFACQYCPHRTILAGARLLLTGLRNHLVLYFIPPLFDRYRYACLLGGPPRVPRARPGRPASPAGLAR